MKLYFEYMAYVLARNILKLFSFNATSSIGGFLLRNLGKYSKYKNIISNNISLLNLNTSRIAKENLDQTGRVFFEFFNLNKFNWRII